MPSPPPPYSPAQPPSIAQATRSSPSVGSAAFSPLHSASPGTGGSEYGTPTSAATTVSPLPNSAFEGRTVASSSNAPPHPSPHQSSTLAFPPPPPRTQRERSSSRPKPEGKHSIFSLSGLASRSRNSEQAGGSSAIEALRQHTTDALSRAPVQPVAGPSTIRP